MMVPAIMIMSSSSALPEEGRPNQNQQREEAESAEDKNPFARGRI